jgi:hypothetical protein
MALAVLLEQAREVKRRQLEQENAEALARYAKAPPERELRSDLVITIDGRSMTLRQWSRASGVSEPVIRARLRARFNAADAILRPPPRRC